MRKKFVNLVNKKPSIISKFKQPLHRVIQTQFGGMESFKRDDLLSLPILRHVSTITRYTYVRTIINDLLEDGSIVDVGNFSFTLKKNKNNFNATPLAERFVTTLDSIVLSQTKPVFFSDILDCWKTDTHITIATKRTALRDRLRVLVREGKITQLDDLRYKVSLKNKNGE